MGLVDSQVFIGTRCRLCRHKDAKFINGWVQYFRGGSLIVQTEDDLGCEPGDSLFLEAYGPKIKGSADAVVVALVSDADPGEEAGLKKLSLRLNGPLKVTDHNEPSRVLVSGMSATVESGGAKIKARVRDVSIHGVGLVLDQEVVKGEIAIVLDTPAGPIKAKAMVRHVRKTVEGFRVGVELTDLSRLDGSRWRKLMGEAA